MVTQKMRILIKTIISNDLAYKYEYFKDDHFAKDHDL